MHKVLSVFFFFADKVFSVVQLAQITVYRSGIAKAQFQFHLFSCNSNMFLRVREEDGWLAIEMGKYVVHTKLS